MSNVNHRYSSQSWTLDLSGKRSPLSRWTGRDVLRNEQFRLSLLGAEGGMAPVVWLSGDRPCFEDFHQTVEAYVQHSLSQPALVGPSAFPAAPPPASDRLLSTAATPVSSQTSAQAPAQASDQTLAPAASQFALAPLGLLRHSLRYQPQDSSPPRQMQLSTLQLADLLAVLDQWQNETLALPESRSHLQLLNGGKDQDFVVPTWARIAASLVVALGATGLGGLLLLQRFPSGTQVALESPSPEANPAEGAAPFGNNGFSGFPTAGGPPLTSQAQNGDAPFQDPLIPPNGDQAGAPPSIVFPPTNAFPPTNGGPTFSGDGVALPSGSIPAQTAPSNANGSFPVGATIATAPAANLPSGSSSAGRQASSDSDSIASSAAESEASQADAPLLATQPNGASPSGNNARTANADLAASAPQQSSSEIASAKAGPNSGAASGDLDGAIAAPGSSRAGQPIAKPAPAAPPAPQVTVANPLPANNQSQAVQSYLQSNWKPPAAIQQPLQYRLNVSSEGKLTKLEPLSPNAQLYVNDANLPAVGTAISGAAGKVQSTLVVTLTPSGKVNVTVEKATPTP